MDSLKSNLKYRDVFYFVTDLQRLYSARPELCNLSTYGDRRMKYEYVTCVNWYSITKPLMKVQVSEESGALWSTTWTIFLLKVMDSLVSTPIFRITSGTDFDINLHRLWNMFHDICIWIISQKNSFPLSFFSVSVLYCDTGQMCSTASVITYFLSCPQLFFFCCHKSWNTAFFTFHECYFTIKCTATAHIHSDTNLKYTVKFWSVSFSLSVCVFLFMLCIVSCGYEYRHC